MVGAQDCEGWGLAEDETQRSRVATFFETFKESELLFDWGRWENFIGTSSPIIIRTKNLKKL